MTCTEFWEMPHEEFLKVYEQAGVELEKRKRKVFNTSKYTLDEQIARFMAFNQSPEDIAAMQKDLREI